MRIKNKSPSHMARRTASYQFTYTNFVYLFIKKMEITFFAEHRKGV